VLLQKMPSSIVLSFGRNNAATSMTRVVKLGNNPVENLATLFVLRSVVSKQRRSRRRRACNAGESDLFPMERQLSGLLRWEAE
jgi:hypothetical protein